MYINHLFYADNSVILAPSPEALQNLLDYCDIFAKENELTYTTTKSYCMATMGQSFNYTYICAGW